MERLLCFLAKGRECSYISFLPQDIFLRDYRPARRDFSKKHPTAPRPPPPPPRHALDLTFASPQTRSKALLCFPTASGSSFGVSEAWDQGEDIRNTTVQGTDVIVCHARGWSFPPKEAQRGGRISRNRKDWLPREAEVSSDPRQASSLPDDTGHIA